MWLHKKCGVKEMQERNGDQENVLGSQEAGLSEEAMAEKLATAAKGGRSRKADGGPVEDSLPREAVVAGDAKEELPGKPSVVEGQVLGRLTIRDLEMMPRIEDIRRLEEIPVGGTTNIEAEVIGAIAGVVTQTVEGVASLGTTSLRRTIRERLGGAERRSRGVDVEVGRRDVDVEVGRRDVIVDISLRVIYGYSIPATVVNVRESVADRLLRLCGLVAKTINIRVIGIEFPARMPGRVQ